MYICIGTGPSQFYETSAKITDWVTDPLRSGLYPGEVPRVSGTPVRPLASQRGDV